MEVPKTVNDPRTSHFIDFIKNQLEHIVLHSEQFVVDEVEFLN